MTQKGNRAQGMGPWDAADCKAKQLGNPFKPVGAKNKAPVVGRKFGYWTAVWTDPLGKRIHCQCVCGRVRVLGLDQLEAGAISSCGCRPPSLQERVALRGERARRKPAPPRPNAANSKSTPPTAPLAFALGR
jgi:hypothetical protein